ncbi:class I SAM-dependent RNA methyltransferase [Thermodesulfobacteriota bacterium]
MYIYQEKKEYFAQTADGTEDLCFEELSELGAVNIRPGFRGIYFNAEEDVLYRINYNSRLISRVLAPLIKFNCFTPEQLYKKAGSIKWADFLGNRNTFAVFANVSNSKIKHSKYAALRVKDAVADEFRRKSGKRPSVNTAKPDVWINLHLENNRATISFDTSGGPLHRRGYRKESVEAPMQETLAAAIIRISEWCGDKPLYDPMCGSGTLLCEALMRYCNTPSGVLRGKFGFEFLPDFNKELWKNEKKNALEKIAKLPRHILYGSDVSGKAVEASRGNLASIEGGRGVNIRKVDFRDLDSIENAVIVCNPPYGIRLKQQGDLEMFYKFFGDFLKKRCKGSTAYIYFGNRELIKNIGLRSSWKKPLKNGGLDGRLVKYQLY